MLLFVYGTLKMGYGNHGVIHGATFLGEYTLNDNFYMVDLGPFPAAIHDKNNTGVIKGELYRIDEDILQATDWLEGYPDFYNRYVVYTTYGEAFIYGMEHKEKNYPVITEWEKRRYA